MKPEHIKIIAGSRAKAHIQRHGLHPEDISAIPAAAGGPKGLILQGLDRFIFTQWLTPEVLARRADNGGAPLQLIGASIGAWRMAAAASAKPDEAFRELAEQYCEMQRYPKGIDRATISEICGYMLDGFTDPHIQDIANPKHKNLVVWVNKGLSPLHRPHSHPAHPPLASKQGFASAVLSNAVNRNNLAKYFERWVFATHPEDLDWISKPFDKIPLKLQKLNERNLKPSLLASGSIPFVLDPVQKIPADDVDQSPWSGPFWDGGLTDYHLALPYHRLPGIVLYPHFSDSVIPGWLDKFLKLRKALPEWMSNVVLVCPSQKFIKRLPNNKIPDRSDFKRHGDNHDRRIQSWRAAISESYRMSLEFENWLKHPHFDD
ncbi:MAG TPA: patatin-like phospholipase family protein [Limnobacter sp.]|uniref:patatin-like phospholipase family protein n=1 Tax=Limnobacter sp. TaxID=2003368 RepID=UPI002E327360|nr:patatin-like phospholipase family protein [Limnobacter sp.]HEX5487078.1 patatin-like phospholipase family protein [Limnobacter sp.]